MGCHAQELSPYQQAHKLTRLPSLLEWLSFAFAAGNLLAGPYFELADYLAYIERKGPWDPRATKQPSLANQYKAGVRFVMRKLPCAPYPGWLTAFLTCALRGAHLSCMYRLQARQHREHNQANCGCMRAWHPCIVAMCSCAGCLTLTDLRLEAECLMCMPMTWVLAACVAQ